MIEKVLKSPLSAAVKAWERERNPVAPFGLVGRLTTNPEKVRKMMLDQPVPRKGIYPSDIYHHHFLMVWDDAPQTDSFEAAYELISGELRATRSEGALEARSRDLTISSGLSSFDKLTRLFFPFLNTQEQRLQLQNAREVYPFSWKIPSEERILYSFGIMDSNVKIILESIARQGLIPRDQVPFLAYKAHRILAMLLKSNDYYFTQYINNTLIHYLHGRVIELLIGSQRYGSYRANPEHLKQFQRFNDVALLLLRQLLTEKDLNIGREISAMGLALEIMAGTTWWHKICGPLESGRFDEVPRSLDQGHVLRRHFEGESLSPESLFLMNDFPELLLDIEEKAQGGPGPRVVFMLDDVGEAVFHFNFIQKFMTQYPALIGSVWVGRIPIENNIWENEANRLIENPYFAGLNQYRRQGRFSIYGYRSPLMSPDVRFLTPAERKTLIRAEAVVVFGANFTETVQMREANTYYFNVPWSLTAAQVAGYDVNDMRGKCYIVHAPRGALAYEYDYEKERFITIRETWEKRRINKLEILPQIGG